MGTELLGGVCKNLFVGEAQKTNPMLTFDGSLAILILLSDFWFLMNRTIDFYSYFQLGAIKINNILPNTILA